MELFIDIIRILTISQLMVLIGLLLRSPIKRLDAWLTVIFCLGLIAYLVLSMNAVAVYPKINFVLLITATLPWSFWMLSKVLFDDDFQLKWWMIGIVVLVMTYQVGLYEVVRNGYLNPNSDLGISLRLVAFCSTMVFTLLALYTATINRKEDLVNARRNFRQWFTYSTAIMILLTVIAEIAFMQDSPPLWLDLVQKTFIFGLTYYFFLRNFGWQKGFFVETSTSVVSIERDKKELDVALVNRLLTAMEKDHIYHREGLSIRQLAEYLQVKEYILRQTINQHLGFRNFNAFLNDYRIEEACQILSQAEHRQLTILEIAYQLGYQSLAPFNKAFKQKTGMTPTEWRKQKSS